MIFIDYESEEMTLEVWKRIHDCLEIKRENSVTLQKIQTDKHPPCEICDPIDFPMCDKCLGS